MSRRRLWIPLLLVGVVTGGWLLGQGMPPGSRVAILADNHPRWIAGYLGIIAAGGAAVPLDTAYHADSEVC